MLASTDVVGSRKSARLRRHAYRRCKALTRGFSSLQRKRTLGQIALTVTEARRLFQLFTALLRDLPTAVATRRMAFHLQWSTWRRRHQARSRWHHYKRRLAAQA